VLRGVGVALSLPWLESLAKPARAQIPTGPKRFVAIYLPCGVSDYWRPPATGAGAAWQLSSVLEPLSPLKSKVTVVSGLELGSVFNADGSSSVQPAHGRLAGAWLTCTDPGVVRQELMVDVANGISVDQIMAAHPVFAGQTARPSMQVGLSSWQSFCDGQPCANSRSVSWRTETEPLFKLVDPKAVFEQLVGVWPGAGSDFETRAATRQSVLDGVKESAAAVRTHLSSADQQRLDEFLSAVRSVERRVEDLPSANCKPLAPLPGFPTVTNDSFEGNTGGYHKGTHADLMNELLALALECDRTRIATYMLEDERSDFIYDHVPVRTFTPLTSAPGVGVCGTWHGSGANGSQDVYSSIIHWNVGKVAALCQRLASSVEEDGRSVLDNSVIFLGSALQGQNEDASRLPNLLVGSGGGALATDRHVDLGNRPQRDLYFTLMNRVYGLGAADFGTNRVGTPISVIDELLA
jgi:hypothetical protein